MTANYFGRSDVALPGFKKFFSAASKEERDHAEQLMDYLNSRDNYKKLLICYFMTRQWDSNKGNCNLSHILEHEFLDEQVKSIKEFGDYIRQLKRAGDGLGEYYFDQKLQIVIKQAC
ncbi:hypothetical protein KUTeg_005345 [Tegillarca granosa]|uniref:Ferritin n=1 Tax=Tegillarca granosa TaxID=220873 RepID=A0ABQ9FMP7_TEGGR|nr:hypothetical protein KUTeg_005345 [Tegillarca granosa]